MYPGTACALHLGDPISHLSTGGIGAYSHGVSLMGRNPFHLVPTGEPSTLRSTSHWTCRGLEDSNSLHGGRFPLPWLPLLPSLAAHLLFLTSKLLS